MGEMVERVKWVNTDRTQLPGSLGMEGAVPGGCQQLPGQVCIGLLVQNQEN